MIGSWSGQQRDRGDLQTTLCNPVLRREVKEAERKVLPSLRKGTGGDWATDLPSVGWEEVPRIMTYLCCAVQLSNTLS